jgi:hypothetical protein
MSCIEADGLSVTYASHRTGSPDLRLIHYNDVYHVEYVLSAPHHHHHTALLKDASLV